MKAIYFTPLLLLFLIPQAFAYNSLENEHLFAESGDITLDLQFGEDDMKYGLSRTVITNTLDDVTLKIYGDEIPMSDPQVKISSTGKHFRVSSIPEEIIMYGHFDEDNSDYKIKLYIAGSTYEASTSFKQEQPEIIEPTNNVIPTTKTDLNILTDQYERVYNKSDYKFFVKTFDNSKYSGNDFQVFQGKVSGAKVSAIIIDPNGEVKSDLSGYVENGIYEGSVYVPENLWQRGWYTVDIVIEFEGKFYQEQLSFYVFGEPQPSNGCAKFINGTCI